MSSKIWKVRGRDGKLTDEELIEMIKKGELSYDDHISTSEMKAWMKIKDTIYQFYLKREVLK